MSKVNEYGRRATQQEAELKKLRRLFYKAQEEIGSLTISLEAVLRELDALKARERERMHG